MTTEVHMPRLSETMTDGKILVWHKKEGDRVNKGDVLAEVETDKANMEIEAVDSGIIEEILVNAGQKIGVGETIAVLNGKGRQPEQKPQEKPRIEQIMEEPPKKEMAEDYRYTPKTEKQEEEEVATSRQLEKEQIKPPKQNISEMIKASPLAKQIARKENVDISQVQGTGPGGRIRERDVIEYIKNKASKSEPQVGQQAEPAGKPAEQPIQVPEKGKFDVEIKPLSRMRQTIATRMTESKLTAPHFYVTYEVKSDKLIEFQHAVEEDTGKLITFNDIFVKATAQILEQYPIFNSAYKGDHIEIRKNINIGIAFSVQDGLLVPVVHDCNKKSLVEISETTKVIKDRVKNNKLTADDMQGGTFSISNMGMLGVKDFQAILNPPEAAGLAIGAIYKAPIVKDDQLAVGHLVNLTLSADHRVVDGAEAARFVKALKDLIENPDEIEV